MIRKSGYRFSAKILSAKICALKTWERDRPRRLRFDRRMAPPPQSRPSDRPLAVLFACGQNSIRSPMAQPLCSARSSAASIYVGSAGVRKGELDPFAVAVMDEIGLDISQAQAGDLRGDSRSGRGSISISSSRSRPRRITARSKSPAPMPSMSNIGRQRTRAPSKAAASSGWRPIAKCATSCWPESGSASSRGEPAMSDRVSELGD